jgi:hypothetical protein
MTAPSTASYVLPFLLFEKQKQTSLLCIDVSSFMNQSFMFVRAKRILVPNLSRLRPLVHEMCKSQLVKMPTRTFSRAKHDQSMPTTYRNNIGD